MREKKEKTDFKTSIGGQALIEGVMMRGPRKQAIVVRTADGLVTKVDEITPLKEKCPVLGWPVIRGVVNFVAMMVSGARALMFSAQCMPDGFEDESRFDRWVKEHIGGEKAEKLLVAASVAAGIGLSVGLFILLPTVVAGLLGGKAPLAHNLAEGALRVAIFLVYLWLATKMEDVRRVWRYHGAEHKAIFCYEKGLELTVENARAQPRLHPRCGTSFLFIVMIVSILVFSVASWSNVWVRMGLRLLLLPLVVGISYELLKMAGRYDNVLTRAISAPGKALQRLTTAEPDDDMLGVSLEALKLVLPEKPGEDRW